MTCTILAQLRRDRPARPRRGLVADGGDLALLPSCAPQVGRWPCRAWPIRGWARPHSSSSPAAIAPMPSCVPSIGTEENFEYRQVALVNAQGLTAVHTGRRSIGLSADAEGQGCAVGRKPAGRSRLAGGDGRGLSRSTGTAWRPHSRRTAGRGSRGR